MVPRSSNDPPSSALLLLPIRPTDHILGPGDASYTLVEYGDYECPDCGRLYLILRDLQKDFAARLRVVYRHYPLSGIHHHAQEAAEAAGAQGKFTVNEEVGKRSSAQPVPEWPLLLRS